LPTGPAVARETPAADAARPSTARPNTARPKAARAHATCAAVVPSRASGSARSTAATRLDPSDTAAAVHIGAVRGPVGTVPIVRRKIGLVAIRGGVDRLGNRRIRGHIACEVLGCIGQIDRHRRDLGHEIVSANASARFRRIICRSIGHEGLVHRTIGRHARRTQLAHVHGACGSQHGQHTRSKHAETSLRDPNPAA
jgi:hypothetical protein